jgi:hypothetical protein
MMYHMTNSKCHKQEVTHVITTSERFRFMDWIVPYKEVMNTFVPYMEAMFYPLIFSLIFPCMRKPVHKAKALWRSNDICCFPLTKIWISHVIQDCESSFAQNDDKLTMSLPFHFLLKDCKVCNVDKRFVYILNSVL